MPVPNCGLHFIQRIILSAESAAFIHMRRAYKPAIKAISPPVISALDTARKLSSRIGHDPRASVPAYVVKSADGLVVVAVDDDALAGNLTQEIVAMIRNLIGAPGAYPRLAVEPLQFIAEDFGIGVIPRWQRCCERLDLCTHSSITERKCMIRQNLDASLRRSSLMQSQGLPTFMNCKSLCAPNQLS